MQAKAHKLISHSQANFILTRERTRKTAVECIEFDLSATVGAHSDEVEIDSVYCFVNLYC